MTSIKEWMDAQWQAKGVLHAANGNVFTLRPNGTVHVGAGSTWNYTSKETKRRQKGLAMYNPKLRDIILAEATREMRPMKVPAKSWKEDDKIEPMPHYTWPKSEPEPVATPRKRVSRKRIEAAAAILAKVPENELAAFLSRFGLTLSAAAAIAAMGDVETMARELLRASL
jgi:hypothetical protein